MKLTRIGYLTKEGFISIFSHGFMSFASVTIIIACLVIMGSFSLLAVNIDALIGKAESENEIVAFIDDTYDDATAMAIEAQIEAIEFVEDAVFVSRAEARKSYLEQFENSQTFEELGDEVFSNRYVISMLDITRMEQIKENLNKIPGLVKIRADLEISQGFINARNIVTAVSLIIVVILVVVSIFIMSNTIKLTTFGRREEIAIMKIVGASNSFIRWPFVIEGLTLGCIGAGLAFLIQWGLYTLVSEKVMQSIVGQIVTVVPFALVMSPMLIIFLCIGFFVGAFGGVIAIRNYLKV